MPLVGLDDGASFSYVDVPSVGVDPAPTVTDELGPHSQVHVDKGDDFFARPGAVDQLDGVPGDDLEAFRIRRTDAWAGDVDKVIEILSLTARTGSCCPSHRPPRCPEGEPSGRGPLRTSAGALVVHASLRRRCP